MQIKIAVALLVMASSLTLRAQELIPWMHAGIHTYTNVTVTSFNATDIFFTHAGGMGNAKLQDLDSELQQRFGYAAGKANPAARQAAPAKAPTPAAAKAPAKAADGVDERDADVRVPQIHAKSFKGSPGPKLEVEKWLTPEPAQKGKFVLVDFWATWCGPCRKSIPDLNKLHAQFGDRLVIIGLSDESEREVRAMKSPKMDYAVAIDPRGRTKREAQVRGIPHAILVDPKGIVRFEGHPAYLNERVVAAILKKYGT